VNGGATLSKCGTFRYRLWRELGALFGKGTVAFVMLNPSRASAIEDDPTIRRCIGFAKTWGYAKLEVVNLHPLRTKNPAELNRRHEDWQMPSDVKNEKVIEEVMGQASLVIAAWGVLRWDWVEARAERVVEISWDLCVPLHALGTTKAGHPRHPLYVRKDARPERWER